MNLLQKRPYMHGQITIACPMLMLGCLACACVFAPLSSAPSLQEPNTPVLPWPAADRSLCAPYFSQIGSKANVYVDKLNQKVYTYLDTSSDFFAAEATCSGNVPHPSIQWHSTLFVPNTYSEQLQVGLPEHAAPWPHKRCCPCCVTTCAGCAAAGCACQCVCSCWRWSHWPCLPPAQLETYLTASLKSPYWLGMRNTQTAVCGNGNYTCFRWRDGSNRQPDATPTSLASLASTVDTYAHWGGSATGYEPNTVDVNCAMASSSAFPTYWYYSGTSAAPSRKTPANYVKGSGQNVWAWRKVGGGCCCAVMMHLPVCVLGHHHTVLSQVWPDLYGACSQRWLACRIMMQWTQSCGPLT